MKKTADLYAFNDNLGGQHMTMLYRATQKELIIGRKLTAEVSGLSAITDTIRLETEKLLDQRRPEGRPSRLSSWFACDEHNFAAAYLEAEISVGRFKAAPNDKYHLYAVEMNASSRQPMVLFSAIARKLAAGQTNTAGLLADEYWAPTQNWSFWEYLWPELTVVAEEHWPDLINVSHALQAYTNDSEMVTRFLTGLPL
jgi:hypothetical protein